jgi:hypothetical protein
VKNTRIISRAPQTLFLLAARCAAATSSMVRRTPRLALGIALVAIFGALILLSSSSIASLRKPAKVSRPKAPPAVHLLPPDAPPPALPPSAPRDPAAVPAAMHDEERRAESPNVNARNKPDGLPASAAPTAQPPPATRTPARDAAPPHTDNPKVGDHQNVQ